MNNTEVCNALERIIENCPGDEKSDCDTCKIHWYCFGYYSGDWEEAEKILADSLKQKNE